MIEAIIDDRICPNLRTLLSPSCPGGTATKQFDSIGRLYGGGVPVPSAGSRVSTAMVVALPAKLWIDPSPDRAKTRAGTGVPASLSAVSPAENCIVPLAVG